MLRVGNLRCVRLPRSRRLATCGEAERMMLHAQVGNLCYVVKTCAKGRRCSEGLPVPQERALLAERSQDGEARAASRERRAGCPTRTSGDGARAAPSRRGIMCRLPTCTYMGSRAPQIANLCYGLSDSRIVSNSVVTSLPATASLPQRRYQ